MFKSIVTSLLRFAPKRVRTKLLKERRQDVKLSLFYIDTELNERPKHKAFGSKRPKPK